MNGDNSGYLLTIDLGTTNVKVLIMDNRGRVMVKSSREIPLRFPGNLKAEVNPKIWWEKSAACIRDALQSSEINPLNINIIGICGLKHAPVLLDKSGEPVINAMLWMDHRCRKANKDLEAAHGQEFKEITGRILNTTLSAAKIRWIYENNPGLLQQAAHFMLPKDYLRYKLTGKIASDLSDAEGTGLLDWKKASWAARLVEIVGFDIGKMPPLYSPAEVVGEVSSDAAEKTGLKPGTPVICGGSDVYCTILGSGTGMMDREDTACLYMGTAAWIVRNVRFKGSSGLLEKDWVGLTATSGRAFNWTKDILWGGENPPPPDSFERLIAEAAKAEPGSAGLLFHPHLNGERGPKYYPEAKGMLYGLTLHHSREHLIRAVLEGVGYSIRALLDDYKRFKIKKLVFTGRPSASSFWGQIIADILDRPLVYLKNYEAGSVGLAILSGLSTGRFKNIEEASRQLIKIKGRYVPAQYNREIYDRRYQQYLNLESRMEDLWGDYHENA